MWGRYHHPSPRALETIPLQIRREAAHHLETLQNNHRLYREDLHGAEVHVRDVITVRHHLFHNEQPVCNSRGCWEAAPGSRSKLQRFP